MWSENSRACKHSFIDLLYLLNPGHWVTGVSWNWYQHACKRLTPNIIGVPWMSYPENTIAIITEEWECRCVCHSTHTSLWSQNKNSSQCVWRFYEFMQKWGHNWEHFFSSVCKKIVFNNTVLCMTPPYFLEAQQFNRNILLALMKLHTQQ